MESGQVQVLYALCSRAEVLKSLQCTVVISAPRICVRLPLEPRGDERKKTQKRSPIIDCDGWATFAGDYYTHLAAGLSYVSTAAARRLRGVGIAKAAPPSRRGADEECGGTTSLFSNLLRGGRKNWCQLDYMEKTLS